tara:strand:- start:3 stop:305 length:303 start_codon:yes stop_codon:yes gene_type:complete
VETVYNLLHNSKLTIKVGLEEVITYLGSDLFYGEEPCVVVDFFDGKTILRNLDIVSWQLLQGFVEPTIKSGLRSTSGFGMVPNLCEVFETIFWHIVWIKD